MKGREDEEEGEGEGEGEADNDGNACNGQRVSRGSSKREREAAKLRMKELGERRLYGEGKATRED